MSEKFSSSRFNDHKGVLAPQLGHRIWAFGGGKGGVGKSFVCSNLAVCIAQLGHSVTVIDLDIGGANLHTCLGGVRPKATLSDFISQRIPHLENIVFETNIPNLKIISGADDSLNATNLNALNKEKLIKAIKALPSDYILLDLGAGSSEITMDFFLSADQSLVVTSPEPTSIENAYRFIKTAFYRKMRLAEENLGMQTLIEEAMDQKNKFGIRTPSDLVRYLLTSNPNSGKLLKKHLEELRMKLIINQTRSAADTELGRAMKSICQKYFGISIDFAGSIDFDNAAWQSLRKKQPLVVATPHSNLTAVLFKLAKELAAPKNVTLQNVA